MNTHNLTRIIKNGEREITNYTLISSNRLKEQKKKKRKHVCCRKKLKKRKANY